jgi:hypothetical protein
MARRSHLIQLLRMIGTIAGTANTITIIIQVQRSDNSIADKIKRGAGRLPLLIFCVVSEARKMHVCFVSDSHRESGVFSFGSALSPVESCPLRSSSSSHPSFTLLP